MADIYKGLRDHWFGRCPYGGCDKCYLNHGHRRYCNFVPNTDRSCTCDRSPQRSRQRGRTGTWVRSGGSTPENIDPCDYCGKTECPCYDERDPDTIVPNDAETNPAVWR